jgi:sulfite oxidase
VNEPLRHPALLVRSAKPFNAEIPPSLLAESFITPNELFYVRNHLPVPKVDETAYALEVVVPGLPPLKLTLEDLRTRFPLTSVIATIQCAGNRRNEMSRVKPVKGGFWDIGKHSVLARAHSVPWLW